MVVEPRSTVPASPFTPDLTSNASANVVLPDPEWPARAMLRISLVRYVGMLLSFSYCWNTNGTIILVRLISVLK